MKNLVQRLLLFFIAIPLLVAAVVFLPQAHHASIMVVVLAFTLGSSLEVGGLFRAAKISLNKAWLCWVGLGIPLVFYASTFLEAYAGLVFMAGIVLAVLPGLGSLAFARAEDLPLALGKAGAYSLVGLYVGVLGGAVTLVVAGFSLSVQAILTFAVLVFGNDSLAWLFGVTLGKKRHLVAASPNKSLAGFFGGMGGSILGSLGMSYAFPAAFPCSKPLVLLLGLLVGLASIVGDLFESSIKRSAGVKDSGSLVPGRGGFLDSFDSVLFAAPVFYVTSLALGLFRS